MSASVSGEIKAEPNLTPLLDVVFQLITFFMLCINFSQENFDSRVRLPVSGSAKPVEAESATGAPEDRLVLNIDRQGHLLMLGKTMGIEDAIKQIKTEAKLIKENFEIAGKKVDPAKGLPTTVVVRGDRDTHFTELFQLITACQANGFRKFEFKAMSSEE